MKKFLFAVAGLLAFSTMTFAQKANAGDFNVGITAGGGLSSIRTDEIEMDGIYEEKSIANIQAGVVFDYAFVDNLFLEGGVTFQRKGKKVETMGVENKTNMFYVEIPVTMNYRINIGDFGLIPQFGPYVGIGVGGKAKTEVLGQEVETDVFGDGAAERLDFGLRMGAGLAFTDNFKLTLGYDMGLLNNIRGIEGVDEVKNKNGVLFGTLTFYIK